MRNNRQAGDHFGWHAATGPDVDKREGHVFVNNLLTADREFARPLLQTIQSNDLCGKLNNSQLLKLDGNVYIRSEDTTPAPLVIWSPVDGESCKAEFKSIQGLQKMNLTFEKHGQALLGDLHSVFKSPELGHYQLLQPEQKKYLAIPPSKEVRQLMKWDKSVVTVPGAYHSKL